MKQKLICLLTAALLLPSQAMAVYETDGVNFIDSEGNIEFFTGYVATGRHSHQPMSDTGTNFCQMSFSPRETIVSEEFEIPSWTPVSTESRMAEIDLSQVSEGLKSLKLSSSSAYDGTYSEMSQSIITIADKYYRIEFDVKGENAWGNIVIANGVKKFLPTGTYDWQRVGLTVKSTDTSVSAIDLAFRSYKKTDGIWIDDITVVELGGEYNVINNGDFEQVFPEEGFLVNDGAMNYLKSVMAEHEDRGTKSTILLALHYTPDWFFENYPEAHYYQEGFLSGDLLDEDYLEFTRTHVQAVAEAINGFDSLHSITLTNEPIYNTSYYSGNTDLNTQEYRDEFVAFLKERYGTSTYGSSYVPTSLISNWGKSEGSYLTWDKLQARSYLMPATNDVTSDGRFWDWMEFNDKIFGDFHKFLADTIHDVDANIPVHAKLLAPVFNRTALRYGTDFEDLNAYFDYNGFDGGMGYNSSKSTYLRIRMIEDLANSASNTPTVNSENHIIPDNCEDFSEKHALIAGADLWQGIIHGRTASATWSWNMDLCLISEREDVQRALGTTLNNANRLAGKIAKVQNADKKFYILYSRASILYNDEAYLAACNNAYEALWSLGQRASFISEKQIADGKLPEDAVLVIPSTSNIDECALTNLNAFTGNTVVIGTVPSKNQYNKSISLTLKNCVTAEESLDSIRNTYKLILSEKNIPVITLKDADGNYLEMTDIRVSEEDGRVIINACNNTWESIPGVSAYYGDEKLTGGTEVISGISVGDSFTLTPFKPVMIEF